MTDHDPLDVLARPISPVRPRAEFATDLRRRLLDALDLPDDPVIDLPPRRSTMPTSTPAIATAVATTAIPYLTVHDGTAALDWYADVFGAVETMRVTGDDGRIGHAEFSIGAATFYLSDEYPDHGVTSPRSLGGTTFAVHLTVGDVDAVYDAAVAAGATALQPPADQTHGNRHGSMLDPFGHRWMLSQPIEQVDVATYAARATAEGFDVTASPEPASTGSGFGQIWAAIPYADAPAGIAFLTDVLGFEPAIVVPNDDDPSVIEHSQLVWPEGGTVQAHTVNRPGNPFSQRPVGSESLYVVTADPAAVWTRCERAGVEVVRPPESPDYAPDSMVFSIRDPEGNIWSFGSYGGET